MGVSENRNAWGLNLDKKQDQRSKAADGGTGAGRAHHASRAAPARRRAARQQVQKHSSNTHTFGSVSVAERTKISQHAPPSATTAAAGG
jgi:hypothetical protein